MIPTFRPDNDGCREPAARAARSDLAARHAVAVQMRGLVMALTSHKGELGQGEERHAPRTTIAVWYPELAPHQLSEQSSDDPGPTAVSMVTCSTPCLAARSQPFALVTDGDQWLDTRFSQLRREPQASIPLSHER